MFAAANIQDASRSTAKGSLALFEALNGHVGYSCCCSMFAAASIQDAFRPTAEGNLTLFEAARAEGTSRFLMIASLNSERCREEFEVRLHSGTGGIGRVDAVAIAEVVQRNARDSQCSHSFVNGRTLTAQCER